MSGFTTLLLRNLIRNPRRTILTTVAISLAAFTYSTLSGLPYLANHLLATPDSARRIVATNASGFFYSLPAAYRGSIAAIPHVAATSGIMYFGGIPGIEGVCRALAEKWFRRARISSMIARMQ